MQFLKDILIAASGNNFQRLLSLLTLFFRLVEMRLKDSCILASGNHFLSIFQIFLLVRVFFLINENLLLKQILHSGSGIRFLLAYGNQFFPISQILLLVGRAFFLSNVNLFFNSVESYFLASGNHFVPIFQISHPLQAVEMFLRGNII